MAKIDVSCEHVRTTGRTALFMSDIVRNKSERPTVDRIASGVQANASDGTCNA
jgi:hypothetical protein